MLGLLVVFLCCLDNTESLLFYYHRPRPISIEPPEARSTQTAPQRAGRRYDSQGIKPSGLGGMERLALRHWHPSVRSA